MLSALAVTTQNIRLGAAIMQIPARQPTTAASAISTIDQLSNGRAMLGLGLSGPQVSEGWYGVPFVSPLGRTGVHRYRPHGTAREKVDITASTSTCRLKTPGSDSKTTEDDRSPRPGPDPRVLGRDRREDRSPGRSDG